MSATDDILSSLPIDELAQQLGADPADVRQAAAATVPALLGGMDANARDGGADSLLSALGQHHNDLLSGGVSLDQVDTADGTVIAGHIFGDQQDAVVSQLGGLPASGAGSLGGSLIQRLLPILAPIVLSYIAGKIFGTGGSGGAGRSGGAGGGAATPQQQSDPTSSGQILPSAPAGSGPSAGGSSGPESSGGSGGPGSLQDMLNNVLGGALGGVTGSGSSGASSGSGGSSGGLDAGGILTDILGGLLGGGRR